MAAKSRTGISGTRRELPQPTRKKTRQGSGSKPKAGKKAYRGQGK